jgi:hypothetical protein
VRARLTERPDPRYGFVVELYLRSALPRSVCWLVLALTCGSCEGVPFTQTQEGPTDASMADASMPDSAPPEDTSTGPEAMVDAAEPADSQGADGADGLAPDDGSALEAGMNDSGRGGKDGGEGGKDAGQGGKDAGEGGKDASDTEDASDGGNDAAMEAGDEDGPVCPPERQCGNMCCRVVDQCCFGLAGVAMTAMCQPRATACPLGAAPGQ